MPLLVEEHSQEWLCHGDAYVPGMFCKRGDSDWQRGDHRWSYRGAGENGPFEEK